MAIGYDIAGSQASNTRPLEPRPSSRTSVKRPMREGMLATAPREASGWSVIVWSSIADGACGPLHWPASTQGCAIWFLIGYRVVAIWQRRLLGRGSTSPSNRWSKARLVRSSAFCRAPYDRTGHSTRWSIPSAHGDVIDDVALWVLQGERIKKLINFDRLRPRRDQEC